eukprot:scaffold403183_cov39-Prasinocladus_malaysianus.AAC.1
MENTIDMDVCREWSASLVKKALKKLQSQEVANIVLGQHAEKLLRSLKAPVAAANELEGTAATVLHLGETQKVFGQAIHHK